MRNTAELTKIKKLLPKTSLGFHLTDTISRIPKFQTTNSQKLQKLQNSNKSEKHKFSDRKMKRGTKKGMKKSPFFCSSPSRSACYLILGLVGLGRATFAASWAASNNARRQIQPQNIEYQEGSSVSLRPYQSSTPERLAALNKGYFLEWKYAAVWKNYQNEKLKYEKIQK